MFTRLLIAYFLPIYESRGLEFKVTYIKGVHDFRRKLIPAIDLADAFMTRKRREAPHLFTCCARDGPNLWY
jgi:hypothetical protein